MAKSKHEIITFKVPESLKEAMKGIPNRSEFIRTAVLAALNSICPLCKGTGIMMPNQKMQWDEFAAGHYMRECETCHAHYIVCATKPSMELHSHEASLPKGEK